MGKLSKISQGLAVAGLFCLGSLQVAKADTLPAGPVYTGVTISYVGTNLPSTVYGNGVPVTETVTFSNIGGNVGIQIGSYPASVPGNGDVYYSPTQCNTGVPNCLLPTSSPYFAFISATGLTIGGTNAAPTVSNGTGSSSGTTNQICVLNNTVPPNFNSCNTNQGTTTLTYLNGLFTLTDQSLAFSFTLPTSTTSTPEPSSLLALGSGLLGLLGYGFRRKCIS
jgi:hypothetical protein